MSMESRSIEEWRLHRLSCLLLPTEEGNGILALGVTSFICVNPLAALHTLRTPHHPLIPSAIAQLLYQL